MAPLKAAAALSEPLIVSVAAVAEVLRRVPPDCAPLVNWPIVVFLPLNSTMELPLVAVAPKVSVVAVGRALTAPMRRMPVAALFSSVAPQLLLVLLRVTTPAPPLDPAANRTVPVPLSIVWVKVIAFPLVA